jgi:hypothetical protein
MSRRLVDATSAALMVVGLGYIVALSARTLPEQQDRQSLLDIELAAPDSLAAAVQWVILALAAAGALLVLVSVAKSAPRERPGARRWVGLLLWIVILFIFYRYLPAEEALTGATAPPEPSGGEVALDNTEATAAWIVGLLLTAVIAAALIRIALLVRSAGSPFGRRQPDEAITEVPPAFSVPAEPVAMALGTDPWSRVITAYAQLERDAKAEGVARREGETARRYARRVRFELNLDDDDLETLSAHYSLARFARLDVTESDAEAAERAWRSIGKALGR